jgi:hypothetical protein
MKVRLAALVVLLLGLPALSFAGSATSRWDLSIGGYVKFDIGWADQAVGPDYTFPRRDSGTKDNAAAETSTLFWSGAQTRLGFRVKGPDAWGAKTSAYIESDFRGIANTLDEYGLMQLRQAWMQFDWPKTSLRMGHDWVKWDLAGYFYVLGINELTPFYKGVRQSQIALTHRWSKEFKTITVLAAPANMFTIARGEETGAAPNSHAASTLPHFQNELVYESDACGKVGRRKFLVGVGGFYGREKKIYKDSATTYGNQYVDSWATTFRIGIPIIPEKSPTDKTGALFVGGNIGYGSNSWYLGGAYVGSYNRYGYNPNPQTSNVDFVSPKAFGGYATVFYHWTNKLWSTFTYAQLQNDMSRNLRNNVSKTGFTAPIYCTNYYINLIYDVNPAIQLGLQFGHLYAKWAGAGTGTSAGQSDRGELNTVRFSANYFF